MLPGQDPLEETKRATQTALERAVGEGRLTLEEFTARADTVWRAQDPAEIARAVQDLPAPVLPPAPAAAVAKVSTKSIFDDVRRSGRFTLRSGTTISAIFGDAKVDLRQAVISEPVVELTVFSCFGDVVITLPKGINAEVNGSVVFGSERVELSGEPALPGSPLLRINARSIFGDVKVRDQSLTERVKNWLDRLS
ncbi:MULTISPECIES: DUF1707 domain-containing protein [unclassified Crossiella]|uniref:DUF1707 SHOCT-like domain-containing protein n=1 Tax=unclassified Crossiella TaxID=2620835 RepID=UPI001FFE6D14|nr:MULTISPECIES: DUF1707 domain-containing protein [unclassified Crossiella]MCK2237626.1 LiaF-related protein [Crossiella sp. S99.2]MCK2254912.1 LiaF-related protein [Crossiella sp. S99.1]